ncbi:MAG: hypothetical protein JNM12_15165 [Alphaproteobacteria bacterium]|nr:hypothetical protein [Alphaproteobacteria bacterium]
MRHDIKGFNSHPDIFKLREYVMGAPDHVWTGRLDYQAWGATSNLFCYFTDTQTGKKWRLSVFSTRQYKPSKGGPAFDEEPLGGLYEITPGKSRNGLPTFLSAKKLP